MQTNEFCTYTPVPSNRQILKALQFIITNKEHRNQILHTILHNESELYDLWVRSDNEDIYYVWILKEVEKEKALQLFQVEAMEWISPEDHYA